MAEATFPNASGLSPSSLPPSPSVSPSPSIVANIDDEVWRKRFTNQQHEFNSQRARLKELYLQKEAECRALHAQLDDARSQLAVSELSREDSERKSQEEIASLQDYVNRCIDGHTKDEIDRMVRELERLRLDNVRLQEQSQQESNNSLVPVFNQVKKTIARTLGADSSSSDHMEDSMRKVKKYAREDAEVLRSLVVPLEEEIDALKEKLRSTAEELQSVQQNRSSVGSALVGMLDNAKADDVVEHPTEPDCSKCVKHVANIGQLQADLSKSQADVTQCRQDLEREAELRRGLEREWQEKREQYNYEVDQLDDRVVKAERAFAELRQLYVDMKDKLRKEMNRLITEREQTARHLEQLQNDNDFLSGRFKETAAEMENERIDLPSSVDDLQLCMLKIKESLIETRIGYELYQRRAKTYEDEARLLSERYSEFENEVETNTLKMREQIEKLQGERQQLTGAHEQLQQKVNDAEDQSRVMRTQEIELREANERLTAQNAELRQKSLVLQQELANTETVQQDFVRLSQSLQMQLEKIRSADTSVRWQDEDDVDQCPSCRVAFAVTRRQVNCRHCGTIYCEKCITKSVQSGRSRKAARVCDVCHTLLERNTAPYFSQAPPQSPT